MNRNRTRFVSPVTLSTQAGRTCSVFRLVLSAPTFYEHHGHQKCSKEPVEAAKFLCQET